MNEGLPNARSTDYFNDVLLRLLTQFDGTRFSLPEREIYYDFHKDTNRRSIARAGFEYPVLDRLDGSVIESKPQRSDDIDTRSSTFRVHGNAQVDAAFEFGLTCRVAVARCLFSF